jgi:hypothetical protein
MASRYPPGQTQKSRDVDRLNAIEDRMGQLASLLSEVAEALAEYPDGLKVSGGDLKPHPETRPDAIRVRAREWLSIDEIERVVAAWHDARRKLPAATETVQVERRHTPL